MRDVFVAAFLGGSLGAIMVQVIRLTVLQPILKRGLAYIREHRHLVPENIKTCKCCVCEHEHEVAISPKDGTTIGPLP